MSPKLLAELARLRQEAALKVLSGTCDPDQYHRWCGYLEGIQQAEAVMLNLSGEIDDEFE